ncbi:MAG: CHAT domain-containing protein [Gammaproteobacteria bacterium]|nr:CHAT domain-containing protein [Gammaproteobacteria bacterium]
MRTTLRLASDQRLYLQDPTTGLDRRRKLSKADFERLHELTREYRESLGNTDFAKKHLNIGRDLFRWLNQDGWLEELLPDISPPWLLEVQVGKRPDDAARALSDAPWELLAEPEGDHLARDFGVQLNPIRRFGTPGEPKPPSPNRLSLVFMAAAPDDQVVLQYEVEEVAILQATEELHGGGHINIDLTVEESGSLQGLSALAAREVPVDVLHLSCHGDFRENEPVLALERPAGGRHDPVDARRILMEPSIRDAQLLFLSACHSADRQQGDDQRIVDSLAAQLLRGGLRASLGWAGTVADAEATEFSGHLYRYLSQHQPLEAAVGAARLALLNRPTDKPRSRDWHRVRLYLGPRGGGVLANGNRARHALNIQTGHREFLDAKGDQTVAVASRYEFVGRRRQIQKAQRALRDPAQAGVLIHGMGQQGKSSLAARIANRLHDHTTVVVYGHYEAGDILAAIARQFEHPAISDIVERHLEAVRRDPVKLSEALRELLQGPCRQAAAERRQPGPLLLVIDDLEQALVLKEGDGYHRVDRPEVRQALAATLHAFHNPDSDSRLLITSRYRFTLPDGQGRDMAELLHHLHLEPMGPGERQKQIIQRRKTLENWSPEREDWELTRRSMELAKGNPGLQELLYRLSINDADTARKAMEGVQAWLEGNEVPSDEEELRKMLEGLVLEQLHAHLTTRERDLLKASTIFLLAVPMEVLDSLAGADPAPRRRLLALGLFDAWPDPVGGERLAAALNPMAQSVAGSLSAGDERLLAGMALPPLWQAWGQSGRPPNADVQLTELALHCNDTEVLMQCAGSAVNALYGALRYRQAADRGTRAVKLLEGHGQTVSPGLLRHTASALVRIGRTDAASGLYLRALDAGIDAHGDPHDYGATLLEHGRLLVDRGDPDAAIKCFEEVRDLLSDKQFDRDRSVVLGDIARIMVSKGQVDDALKLHQEMIEVFQALGDQRSRAVTLGDIARIMVSKGQVDDALKLHQERLAVNRELGDKDGIANALWSIGRIESQQGQAQSAFEHMHEAYQILLSIGRLDGIVFVGLDLGQLLAMGGHPEDGLQVLERSRQGLIQLGKPETAAQVEAMMAQIRNDHDITT